MRVLSSHIQFILAGLLCFNFSQAQAVDYSLGNSNPFVNYKYQTESSNKVGVISNTQEEKVNYILKTLPNNKIKQSTNKYQNLLESSQELNGCWDRAAKTYGVDPWLLMAIAQVESGFKRYAINKNSNASVDLGMMQINSFWLPTLKKFGIDTRHLFEPCTSVFVGAWIVKQNINRFGYNQDGIGAYNSPNNITIRRNYAKKVYNAYNQLLLDFKPQLAKN